MRRFIPLLVAGVTFIAAACSDTMAPTRSVDFEIASGSRTVAAAKKDPKPSEGVQTWTAAFVIPAAGGTVRIGDFKGLRSFVNANTGEAFAEPSIARGTTFPRALHATTQLVTRTASRRIGSRSSLPLSRAQIAQRDDA